MEETMTPEDFSLETYSNAFKRFRNQYRKYPLQQIVFASIQFINQPKLSKLEQLERKPWFFLLLIKWVFGDPLAHKSTKKPLTTAAFQRLVAQLDDLEGKARLPSQFESIGLFMRAMASQQLQYQRELASQYIARQSLLFSPLEENHTIHTNFIELTGLTINQYLDLSFITFVGMLQDEKHNNIDINFF